MNVTVLNSAAAEARAWLSHDGLSIYFHTSGRGGFGSSDIFVSTRTKLGDDDDGPSRRCRDHGDDDDEDDGDDD